MFDRSELVAWLLERLSQDVGVAVGDHGAPDGVGWSNGEPNVGDFVPYLVVMSDAATPMREPLNDRCWDWRVQFNVRGFSETRERTDRLAGLAAASLLGVGRICDFPQIGDKGQARFVIDHVQVDSVSGVIVNKQFSPYLYSASVSFTCMTMKKR